MTFNTQTPFEKSVAFTLKAEGGYKNWSTKMGGPTNRGIILSTLENYRRNNGSLGANESLTAEDVKALTENEAKEIYQNEFWNKIQGDQINNQAVALTVFDEAVHRNPKIAIKSLQRSLGVTPDGVLGTETLTALNGLNEEQTKHLAFELLDKRRAAIAANALADPDQNRASKGYLNRVNKLEEAVSKILGVSRPKSLKNIIKKNERALSKGFTADYVEDVEDYLDLIENEGIALKPGMFRFNDVLLPMPPESIQILTDEYEDALLLMRTEVPAVTQTGRKRVRIIVNFPIELDSETNDVISLSKIIIQIRKTPIATIDNEKIRKEIFGSLDINNNIGVVVDNISGYIDDSYPNLLRCTLQMSWFNHLPYVDELKYVKEMPTGEKRYQLFPSDQFTQFYSSGTLLSNNVLINYPGASYESLKSLKILYKEFYFEPKIIEFQNATSGEPKNVFVSALSYKQKAISDKSQKLVLELKKEGWYLAEDESKFYLNPINPVFYRWREFEIPFSDLSNGALMLQNMSFSLSTNPSYITLEQHSIPTIQFLGGSVADIRALIFADADKEEVETFSKESTPIGTSTKLGELQAILKQISEDRIKYPKFAKNNHLLIAHPLVQLMKYKIEETNQEFTYLKTYRTTNNEIKQEKIKFNVNNYLPVVVSSTKSSTVEGVPFATNYQIDFKETRLGKKNKNLRYTGGNFDNENVIPGSDTKNSLSNIHYKIINKILTQNKIEFDKTNGVFVQKVKENSISQRGILINKLIEALNNSAIAWSGDKVPVQSLEDLFKTEKYLLTEKDYKIKFRNNYNNKTKNVLQDIVNAQRKQENQIKDFNALMSKRAKNQKVIYSVGDQLNKYATANRIFFNQAFATTIFVPNFYILLLKDLNNGDEWVKPYLDLFDEYASQQKGPLKDLYPDMMLPKNTTNPAFYFKDNNLRIENYKNRLAQNFSGNAQNIGEKFKEKVFNPEFAKSVNPEILPPKGSFDISRNVFSMTENKGEGLGLSHDFNQAEQRIALAQKTIANITSHMTSLAQVYPTFQVQLFSPRYNFFQKFSAADIKADELLQENQRDLLDIFDLSSIIDIRIIKDEHEAADVMVIRVLATDKELMSTVGDPIYDPEQFSWTSVGQGALDFINSLKNGNTPGLIPSTINNTFNSNLEKTGLKEGTPIKALLGYANSGDILSTEFIGRIAAISGKDVLEIYCIGNGHELIQNTLGFKEGSDNKYTLNSDTPDLIKKILSENPEVKSFGNTQMELFKGFTIPAPFFLGGRSAFDNIQAPTLHPSGNAINNAFQSIVSSASKLAGLAGAAYVPLSMLATSGGALAAIAGTILGGATLGTFVISAAMVGVVVGVGYTALRAYATTFHASNFTIFQQTIWDVCQEMTYRHPGHICSVVPFDNRSTLFFGEPDCVYFYRGPESALEKVVLYLNSRKMRFGDKNTDITNTLSRDNFATNGQWTNQPRITLRELSDRKSEFSDTKIFNLFNDPTTPISTASTKERLQKREEKIINGLKDIDIDTLAIEAMQKPFRNYHLVTSEHDIITNQIDASALDVANSVQIYHPNKSRNSEFGQQYVDNYELTEYMKADDDLFSHLINNKVFTFHNAHTDNVPDMPERYAKAILCKELGKIYKGKIVILGRPTIKPHDIIVLRDTYNQITGPVSVSKVVQTISPSTGWITIIYPNFIAIPDTSAGALQMLSLLKACRFWLADEGQLFYTNMEKFTPSENTGAGASDEETLKAIKMMSNQPNTIDKELIYKEGAQSFADKLSNESMTTWKTNAVLTSSIAGTVAAPVSSALIANSATATKGVATSAVNAAGTAFKAGIGQGVLASGSGLLRTGLAVTKTVGITSVLAGSTFVLSYLLDYAQEAFVNWSKYREPIYIFPLKKENKPWMAALNGFKENTPLEHMELAVTRAADKMGAMMNYAEQFYKDWVGESPNALRPSNNEIVARVVDGDTIYLASGEHIRIKGVDTAETKPDQRSGYVPFADEIALGNEAKRFLKQLIENKPVTISRENVDRYGRTVAKVYYEGRDISNILFDLGLSKLYTGDFKGTNEERHAYWSRKAQEYKEANKK